MSAEQLPVVYIGDAPPPARGRGRGGRGRGRGRGGAGRGRGGGRGAVPRAVAQAQNLDGDDDAALPHQQSLNWFGTITNLEGWDADGNPNPEDPQRYIDFDVPEGSRGDPIVLAQWQGERGLPSERRLRGLLHVQIMLRVNHIMRYNQINAAMGLDSRQARWFVCRSPPHAWDYCAKDESRLPGAAPKFFGERPTDAYGKRKQSEEEKVDILVKAVEDKVSYGAMWKGEDRGLMLRHHRAFLDARNVLDQPSFDFIPKLIYYIHGSTGSDKSKNLWRFVKDLGLPYWVSGGLIHGRYFTGHDNQPVAIFDEVRQFQSVSILLQILDGRESVQEWKLSGVRCIFRAKIIIMTSDRPLEQIKFLGSDPNPDNAGKEGWFPATADEMLQIKRRIRELPRVPPGQPNPWLDHPIGNILHYADTRLMPHFVNRPLPLLTNAQRASLKVPLISPEEERRLFPHLYGLDGPPIAAQQQQEEDPQLQEWLANLQQMNQAAEQEGINLLDDDLGLPEPQGSPT